MTDTFKRGLIASAAVGSVVMALTMSGGLSQAASPDGIYRDGQVVCDGQNVGKDPDRNIQTRLLWDCGRSDADGGGAN